MMGRAKLIRVGWIVAGVVGAALAVAFVWDISAQQAQSTLEARHHAQERAERARESIARTCRSAEPDAVVECVAKEIQAAREDQRAEYDLSAQERMAAWAFWAMVIAAATAGLTAIALWFVKGTLDATRKAVIDTSEATKAMLAANVIAEGVAAQTKRENETRERENIPAVLVVDATYRLNTPTSGELTLTLENVGRQAAVDVYVISREKFYMAEGQWHEERMSMPLSPEWLAKVPKDGKRRAGAVGINPRKVIIPANFPRDAPRNSIITRGAVVYSDANGRTFTSQFFYWGSDDVPSFNQDVPMTAGTLRTVTFEPYDGPELRDREGY